MYIYNVYTIVCVSKVYCYTIYGSDYMSRTQVQDFISIVSLLFCIVYVHSAGEDPEFVWVGGGGSQVHNVCIVSNMKRRGVLGPTRVQKLWGVR